MVYFTDSFSVTLIVTLIVILGAMTSLWLLSLIRRDASIVDPFWGAGFVLVVVAAIKSISVEHLTSRAWLLIALTVIWAMRLSLYLLWRNWGHGEDRRYRAMRDHYGPQFWWVSLLIVFWLQAVILWIVSLPIQATLIVASIKPLGLLDGFGCAVWCLGLFFEAVGDFQMARFQADPLNAGRVMDRGLWRYTRHPNYFGDFCIWWGLYLVAANGGAAWTVFSPLMMSYLLLKVSGVTLLEQTIVHRRPDYLEYQQRTNSFFPGPPRKL